MAGVVGTPRNYDQKWNFAVEIDGLEVAWFESVSGLEFEVGVIEQHEGGSIVVADQSPGKVKYTPCTLTNGVTDNREMYEWALLSADAAANAGEPLETLKKQLAVVAKDRDGSEKRRYTLFQAFVNKHKCGEWDAKAEENVMEETTLTYKYFERQDS